MVSCLQATSAAGQDAISGCKYPHGSKQTIGNRFLNHGSNRPKGKANHLVIKITVATAEQILEAKGAVAEAHKVGDTILVALGKSDKGVAVHLGDWR